LFVTPLGERILAHLRQYPGQYAREIAQALRCEKTEVNSCLYGELSSKVAQTHPYRWSLAAGKASSGSTTAAAAPGRLDTPLAKLSRYYLDCISFDDEGGASFFAESKFEQSYVELPENPLVTEHGLAPLIALLSVQRLLAHVRQDRKRLGLVLGYPCYLKRIRSKRGWEGMMIEPLFLFPVTKPEGNNGGYVIDVGSFTLNFPLLARLSGVEGQASMEEGLALLAELGVSEGPPPDWEDFFARLHHLRPDWMWHEAPLPVKLGQEPSLSTAQDLGFYNRSVLFGKEQSPYTVGLEKELAKLQEVRPEQYAGTALGAWIRGEATDVPVPQEPILEVVPLNSEQRLAVRLGLSAPLTIVTGPPGTGKSQVVTSLLLNAAWKSKKVLFASKNHKAVEVVETRVNTLGPRPILLRLGTDRVRAELAEYLLGLLAAVTTPEDEARYRENLRLHEESLAKSSKLEKQAQALIDQRNTVDELERKVEPLRQRLGEERFAAYRRLNLLALGVAMQELAKALHGADRETHPFFTRLFWGFSREERWLAVRNAVEAHRSVFQQVGIELPTVPTPADDNLGSWRATRRLAEEQAGVIREIQRYSDALETLGTAGDLSSLHAESAKLTEESQGLCHKLWNCWLALQPSKLAQNERRLLRDYASVLQLIVQANETGGQLGRDVFARYYKLFPEIAHLLPCWAVTSLSASGRIPLEPGFFDLVVIDEASQCDIASALPLLYRAKAAVIIGDPKQLRHISSLAPHRDRELLTKHGLVDGFLGWSYSTTSLFDLSTGVGASGQIVALRDHHRCHHEIIEFSNRAFYQGRLRVATKHDRLRSVTPGEVGIRWIATEGTPRPAPVGGSVNTVEAEAVCRELRRVVMEQRYRGTIGVVTPFRAQANLINEMVRRDTALAETLVNAEFLAETAHRFQGDERDLILFSPVVGPGLSGGSISFLSKTPNVFNVAITRARCCLAVVGSRAALGGCGVEHMEAFARYFDELRATVTETPREGAPDLGPRYPKVARPELVSDWEHRFYERLYRAGVKPIPQYPVEGYLLDFAVICGERRLNIEVDGERYHRAWDGELLLRDRLRNQRLIELGWDVQRFWVYQIRDEPERCVERVLAWLKPRN
jgi:very-short-patch-repair endonuclease